MSLEQSLDRGSRVGTLKRETRRTIFLYLGVLIFLLAFGAPHGGLIDIPLSFLLKNKLHLSADDLSIFKLLTAGPLYVSFIFGFIRDSCDPFGMKDRGYMLIFGTVGAMLYGLAALMPLSYWALLASMLLLTSAFLFVSSAQNGLSSALGQQHAMPGQISAAWNIFASLPTIAALLIGGALSDTLESQNADQAVRLLFLFGAIIMAGVAAYGVWRPGSVYDNIAAEAEVGTHPFEDLQRLSRHWPIYPALAIWTLWNFAPGSVTPLQYYLQNSLHASDAHWGQWNAIFAASFIPTFVVFGLLCRRIPLRALLWWGTIVAVPQLVPMLFITSIKGALIAAVPMGLMGGVATAGYMDLIIRSCPPGLQGTTLMLSASLLFVSTRFGDVLGAKLFDHYGNFTVCVVAITIAYALILPLLLLVPKELVATTDGEPPEAGTAVGN
jgi:predicted MFS family arabinose efflux permease